MPIRAFLAEDQVFDPEVLRAMGVAFEHACQSLRLADKSDQVTKLIAHQIIEAAKRGERDPNRLFDAVMEWAAAPHRELVQE